MGPLAWSGLKWPGAGPTRGRRPVSDASAPPLDHPFLVRRIHGVPLWEGAALWGARLCLPSHRNSRVRPLRLA
ncbi:hypothetical protein GW17_00008522 [Ensete ventricosum]|uniref:Uncharacterized protein n=1 Tax=Ensete ventricosum TaxID=4639 RepID=A0A444FWT2_ENSVE|nr:hypothetical protein B296_00015241 [Ensete ventricosum]RWW27079.1 hypothetical protein GW17_00008522 [Ensete ventricosum]RZR73397.1 hypothetical protein BHM03_00023657 [Ensete ventricosum]